jgi:Ca2+-binding RTX toxin-like protein
LGTGVVSIESLAILPGSDTRFGDPGTNSYNYNITTVDQNVASGVQMTVDASRLRSGENFTFNGAAETDGSFFVYGGVGVDNLIGGEKNDVFLFGMDTSGNLRWGSSDQITGGNGLDQLGLRGDYSALLVFGATQLISIESIGLVSAHDTRFGPLGARYSYNLQMNDGNVALGQQVTVDGTTLRADEILTFNGSAEQNGSFRVFGGTGNDTIIGSAGSDLLAGGLGIDFLTGGGGADTFLYRNVAESTQASHDTIQDFTLGDIIDLAQIDANTTLAGDQAFTFIGAGAFDGTQAGELRMVNTAGSTWLVQGDINGDTVVDFELIVVTNDAHPLTQIDFHF